MKRPGGILAALIVMSPGMVFAAPSLLVVNKSDSTLAIVDADSLKVLTTIATGESPHEVEVSSDGRLAFVSNYGSPKMPGHTLSIIDLAQRKELRRADLGELHNPHGLAVHAGKVYVTAQENRLVARYDVSADRVDWTFSTGQEATHMVEVNRDGTKLVTANITTEGISVIERAAGSAGEDQWRQTIVTVGKGPEGIDFSPDERELWAANSLDGSISIVDIKSKRVVHTIQAQTEHSNRLRFTPDGRSVLVTDVDGGSLVIFDARKRVEKKRLMLGKGSKPKGIAVTADSKRAYIALNGADRVVVIDLQKQAVISEIATGRGPDGLTWIADSFLQASGTPP